MHMKIHPTLSKPLQTSRCGGRSHSPAIHFPKQTHRLAPLCSTSSDSNIETQEDLSEQYTDTMQERMGSASLIYRHEDGMNYHRILDDLIVGSCLHRAEDVDTLADREGVKTVLCLQEDSDMAYFSLDVAPIRSRCSTRGDISHLRHAIRDFDPFSLRRRLPEAVALLTKYAEEAGGTSYIHCTAGLGRAPATALAYMWWIKGIPLDEAYVLLTGIRPCKPKADAIRAAAVDILYGQSCTPVTITLLRRGFAQRVDVAGLDVGWGQSVPLKQDKKSGRLAVTRHLPAGKFQFKFIYDGDLWGPSIDHMLTLDGDNLNNVIICPDEDKGPEVAEARARIRAPGGELTPEEYERLRHLLKEMDVNPCTTSAPCKLG